VVGKRLRMTSPNNPNAADTTVPNAIVPMVIFPSRRSVFLPFVLASAARGTIINTRVCPAYVANSANLDKT